MGRAYETTPDKKLINIQRGRIKRLVIGGVVRASAYIMAHAAATS